MLENYFKVAKRTLVKSQSYALINVMGLALGLAACIMIFIVIQNELSYDRFHEQADNTYRVTVHGLDYNPSVSFAVAPAFRNDFPEVEHVSQYYYRETGLVKIGDTRYTEGGYAFADNDFFQIFDFTWLAGNSKKGLKEPNATVITESIARKYFGSIDVLGKTIRLDDKYDLQVTGVIKDLPSNTHFTFVFLVSWETIGKEMSYKDFWQIQGGSLYVALPTNVSEKDITARLPAFIHRNWGEHIARESYLILQPLKDIHFDRRYLTQISMPRSKETIYGLAGVALFIILSACINFVNLAIAQSLKRAKEVGIRKVLGASRKQLIIQILCETTLLVSLSIVVAFVAIWLFLPYTKALLDIRIAPAQLFSSGVLNAVGGTILITIFIAGLYPALIQSRFLPVTVLKSGMTENVIDGSFMRKGLVVLQFTISQVLLIGTIIIGSQMNFFLNQGMGFDKEAIVTFPTGERIETLYQKLRVIPGIQQMSFASGGPAYSVHFAPFSSPELGMTETDVTEIKHVDENYISMFKLELLAGSAVSKTGSSDTISRAVVNETLINRLGIPEPQNAIGKQIRIGRNPVLITGVVRDFQSESKHHKIRSCIIWYNPKAFWQASVKLEPRNMRETLAAISKTWSELNRESLFTYEFVDEHISKMYSQEEKMYTAFKLFSGIAILIGCLGLYGLVSLMAAQRTKEVGIRKVLGASVTSIVALFINQFSWLIAIAFTIAAPLAWYAMNTWLQEFAYHIDIGAAIFLLSLLATFVITGASIGYQSTKAALANPVDSLKSE